jgi:hypothetical protein
MPERCAHCGAVIDPLALACPFCRTVTAAGVTARQRDEHERRSRAEWQAQAQAQAQYHDQVAHNVRVAGAASQSLLWSILGSVLCCAPLGIVGIVMGVRARSLAAQRGLAAPAKAAVGLALGTLSTVGSIGFFVYAIVASQIEEGESKDRIAAIEKQLGSRVSAPTLDRETACGLAEIHALRNGWQGNRGAALSDFDCLGKVTVEKEHASLDRFRFMYRTGNATYDVHVCYQRGGKWYVTELRDGPCASSPDDSKHEPDSAGKRHGPG